MLEVLEPCFDRNMALLHRYKTSTALFVLTGEIFTGYW